MICATRPTFMISTPEDDEHNYKGVPVEQLNYHLCLSNAPLWHSFVKVHSTSKLLDLIFLFKL